MNDSEKPKGIAEMVARMGGLGMAGLGLGAMRGPLGELAREQIRELREADERSVWEQLHGKEHPRNVAIRVAYNYPFTDEQIEPLARMARSDEALVRKGLDVAFELTNKGVVFRGLGWYGSALRLAVAYIRGQVDKQDAQAGEGREGRVSR